MTVPQMFDNIPVTRHLDCVIVPRHILVELENARKELYEVITDVNTIMRLRRLTSVTWRLANRKWPSA